ncbi:MAG: hypothetical protein ACI4KM_02340 [Oscillospiraceae bacterium]
MDTITYQCPNCNAALEYGADGKLHCFYCDSEFSEAQIKQLFEENENNPLSNADSQLTEEEREIEEFSGASALYTCPNCGAGVICDSLTSSTRCHFCHTPVILSGRLSGEFKPNMIIPFSTTREQAHEIFHKYTKNKFLLPRGFKENAKINDISALYVPYWLKSGITDAQYSAQGKIVRTWRTGNTIHTHTKVYQIQREAEFAFIRVPCDGSKRIDDSLMESIEPFDYKGIKPFSMSYLSGCAAEKYDVTKEEAAKRIDMRIQQAAQSELRASAVGYSSISDEICNACYRQQTYVYALLPVWFLNYTYKGKDYAFAVNGQNLKHFGELPVSGFKKFLFGLGIFAVTTLIIAAIGGVILLG